MILKTGKVILSVLLLLVFVLLTGCRDKAYQNVKKAPESFSIIIAEGLTDNLKIRNCYTVPSKDYPGSHYAAAELFGGKMKGDVVGVWIIEDYDNPGNVLSVDQTAIAFSTYKAAKHDKPDARITNVKEARILKKYVEREYYKE